MPKILAFDVGAQRTGVAETDDLGMMAFPVETIATTALDAYLQQRMHAEGLSQVVLGYPTDLRGGATDATALVEAVKRRWEKVFPGLAIALVDERFTSKMATQALIQGGAGKKARSAKGARDAISAALILNSYLQRLA